MFYGPQMQFTYFLTMMVYWVDTVQGKCENINFCLDIWQMCVWLYFKTYSSYINLSTLRKFMTKLLHHDIVMMSYNFIFYIKISKRNTTNLLRKRSSLGRTWTRLIKLFKWSHLNLICRNQWRQWTQPFSTMNS